MDWNDLRYILAVYDNGSALAASQKLGVNASTVQRRIAGFEHQNNVRLFERLQSGYTPTSECHALVEISRDMDESVTRIGREILGRDLRLEGRLVVTTTDTFVTDIVARHISEFHRLNPNITIEMTITNARLSLSRQDADIAIRPSSHPDETLVGQRVTDLAFGIYAAHDIAKTLQKTPTLAELRHLNWLGGGNALSGSPSQAWMNDNIPTSSIWFSVDTYPSLAVCTAQSMGVAILPCAIADPMNALTRIACPWFEMSAPVWVLTHREIRNAARVRAFMDHISKAIRNDRAIWMGQETAN
jgi:DNA-binding transcriptional LysR family regulator